MKILKRILIVLVILICVAAIIGMLLPSHFHIERSLTLNAKPAKVFSYLDNMKKDAEWSPWFLKDTTTLLTYEGPESGVGAKQTWKSNNSEVGNGRMETVESVPNEKIKREMYFMEETKPAYASFVLAPEGDGTRVTWMMDNEMGGNPFMHIMAKVMSGFVEKEFEKGLATMKTKIENMPDEAASDIKIEETTVNAMHYLGIRDTASSTTVGQKLGQYYGMIQESMKKQKLNFAGSPIAIYYNDSKTNWDMEAAIPVDKPGNTMGNVKPGEMKAGNAIVAHYFGAYEKIGVAWESLSKYIAANNKKVTGPPWEVYITDPMTEKDTAKWQTNIYFPVQ